MCAAVLRVLVGWVVELVGVEELEVASVGYTFWIGSRLTTFMIFTTFYHQFLAGADEELYK